MAALTKDRNTPERSGKDFVYPVAAATRIFAGALVVLDAGVAKPGAAGTGLASVGRADAQADNRLGAAGDTSVRVRAGVFHFNNSADADLITLADVGKDAWIVDDQTVAKTGAESAGNPTRSKAGRIVDVDGNGVWVSIG